MARDIHRQNDEAMMRACMAPSSSACISHMQALLDGQSVLNANGAVLGSSAPDFNAQTLLNSTKISGLINDWKQGIPPRFDGRLVDKRSGIELNPVVHNGETYYLQPLTAEEVCGLSRDCHADLKAGLSFTKLGLEAITGKDGNVYYRGFTDKQVADQVAKGFGVASIAFGGAGQKAYSFTASVVGAGVSIVTADNKLVEIPAQIVGFAAGQIVPKVVSESIELGPIGSAALSGVSGDAVSSGVRDSLTVEK